MSTKPFILSIEGNIGAGKSTLLRHLKETILRDMPDICEEDVQFMQEPVDIWETIRDADGETILAKFYKEPAKYSFAFQTMAYTSRLLAFQRTMAEHPTCKMIVCERSLEADYNIFAKMMKDDGCIEDVNFQIYKMIYSGTAHTFNVDAIVYLRADPAICMERVGKRAREGEGKITLEYLEWCDEYYNTWITNINTNKVQCITLNANINATYQEGPSDPEVGLKWVELIREYFIKRVLKV